ncbi:hypothetical protein [Actinokineospora iranica]|uniref:Uncharacterized protein n=1 Tax=Actinokineospora iranica TaxID=1271860 RepID=A0A1G6LQ71_9PSEU|nr:hypothetical protein [Actinokineospora iranica]SDC45341.1 hypothetical protein SAMN05216174_102187 [Actinokineospora iranica]
MVVMLVLGVVAMVAILGVVEESTRVRPRGRNKEFAAVEVRGGDGGDRDGH